MFDGRTLADAVAAPAEAGAWRVLPDGSGGAVEAPIAVRRIPG